MAAASIRPRPAGSDSPPCESGPLYREGLMTALSAMADVEVVGARLPTGRAQLRWPPISSRPSF